MEAEEGMTPISPVLAPEWVAHEKTYAEKSSVYTPLPVIRNSTGVVLSRWHLTDKERKAIANGADVFLSVWTFLQPLQPLRIEIGECDRSILEIAEHMGLVG